MSNSFSKVKNALSSNASEYIIVKNTEFVYSPYECYPLPPKVKRPLTNLEAVVMDMDGTTTTTEVICIHALEYMVRQISGKTHRAEWPGLSERDDYPFIIGNSTTKHIEHLMQRYGEMMKMEFLFPSYFFAAFWTMTKSKDPGRIHEVIANIKMIEQYENVISAFQRLKKSGLRSDKELGEAARKLFIRIKSDLQTPSREELIRLATDIYYQRYHFVLNAISAGHTKKLIRELPPHLHKQLIEPMEGIGELIALLKGTLGENAGRLAKPLYDKLRKKNSGSRLRYNENIFSNILCNLGKRFQRKPVKIALVTSSLFYEAEIVLSEIFKRLYEEVEYWNIPKAVKSKVKNLFESHSSVYDAIVTASDSHEFRLKPHPDLYTIALYKMAIPKNDFGSVIGFEDSESGITSIKAAGIGTAAAVPFAESSNHNLSYADFILHGGIPEAILQHNLFMKR